MNHAAFVTDWPCMLYVCCGIFAHTHTCTSTILTHDNYNRLWQYLNKKDYQELLSSYIAQNNELQVRGSKVLIQGSSSVELQEL